MKTISRENETIIIKNLVSIDFSDLSFSIYLKMKTQTIIWEFSKEIEYNNYRERLRKLKGNWIIPENKIFKLINLDFVTNITFNEYNNKIMFYLNNTFTDSSNTEIIDYMGYILNNSIEFEKLKKIIKKKEIK